MNSKPFRIPRQLGLLAVGALFLTSCQPAPTAPSSGTSASPGVQATAEATSAPVTLAPGEITAGVGIKEIHLDQTKPEIEKAIGAPEEVDSNEYAPGQTYALYYTKGIELSYSEEKLSFITLHGSEGKWKAYAGGTKEGLGVGSSAKQISEALGEPDDQGEGSRAMRYRKLGLWFRLDADRSSDSAKAESLQVMKPE